MAGSELSGRTDEGFEPNTERHDETAPAERHEGDLRSLLTMIVEQIAEADRRNSETLQQLQDRLATLGRDTQAIKPRLPDQFAPAFERIEAGVAELAARISEAAEQRISNPEQGAMNFDGGDDAGAMEPAAWHAAAGNHERHASASEQADALKPHSDGSFVDPFDVKDHAHPAGLFGTISHFDDDADALRTHGEGPATRQHPDVDTFDIIESDPPGNSDPWDRESADALIGLYHDDAAADVLNRDEMGQESTGQHHSAASLATPSFSAMDAASGYPDMSTAMSFTTSLEARNLDAQNHEHSDRATADKQWLEARFAEIARRIEESLNDIRPDQGFFALNQRVDEFEQNFANAIEGIARGGDAESMQAIGDHVTALAAKLEATHSRLQRLDEIEEQLAVIATKLEDVHHAATVSLEGGDAGAALAMPAVDLDAVARTAAEAAAAEIGKHNAATPESSELSAMLHDFMAEQRRGDENTAALLDTLQQAMIRLLDRVDNIDGGNAPVADPSGYHAAAGFASAPEPLPDHGPVHGPVLETVAAAVAAEARARHAVEPPPIAMEAAPSSLAEPFEIHHDAADRVDTDAATISPEKIRQDFIAEARRAKMRLSQGAEDDAGAAAAATSPAALRNKVRPATVAAAEPDDKEAAATNSSRLRIMALAAMLALGGAYLTVQSGVFSSGDKLGAQNAAPSSTAKEPSAKDPAAAAPAASGSSAPATDPGLKGVTPIGKQGAIDPAKPAGTEGTITTDEIVVGATSVPLYGVAVDTEQPVTAAGLEMARRQQAMANVSSQLGEAAVKNRAATAMPAALNTADDPAAATSAAIARTVTGATEGGPLDLPPATVGPLSLRLAAANGDPSAQFEVGSRLAEGSGTEQTFKDAAKWYQRAASQGLAQAQYRLGTLYERGLGLRKDQARAEDWYRRAADQGNVKAMHNLAVLRANASHGSPDYMSAAQWFEKAAERGLSDSQFNLAVLEENGLGVPQDMVAAYKWMALAAKGGDSEAIRRRDILKGKLTADQLSKAEAQVTAFRLKRPDPGVNDAFKAGEAWKRNPSNGLSG